MQPYLLHVPLNKAPASCFNWLCASLVFYMVSKKAVGEFVNHHTSVFLMSYFLRSTSDDNQVTHLSTKSTHQMFCFKMTLNNSVLKNSWLILLTDSSVNQPILWSPVWLLCPLTISQYIYFLMCYCDFQLIRLRIITLSTHPFFQIPGVRFGQCTFCHTMSILSVS